MVFDAILSTIYWLSFPYVGLHVLALLETRWKTGYVSKDPIIRLFIGMCLGFASFLPLAFLAYIFSLSVEPVSLLWAFLVIGFLTKYRNNDQLIKLTRSVVVSKPLWLLLAIISADYAVTLYIGGYFSGDAWGHMSRINDILNNGFTFFDPYFPNLVDARYNLSLTHALHSVGASLTGQTATEIWFYSLAFFRSAMALSVYVAMKLLTKSKLLSAATASVGLIALSYDWRFVHYPNRIVRLWFVFMVLGLIRVLNKPDDKFGRLMVITAALLIATTHPVFSAGAAGFVLLALFINWILARRNFNIRKYLWLLGVLAILLLPTVFGASLETRGMIGQPQSGETVSVGGFEIINPADSYNAFYLISLLIVGFYTFGRQRSKGFKSVTLSTIFIYPIIAFTPIFIVLREFLSARIIQRYKSDTNFLSYSLWLAPAILVCTYFLTRIAKKVSRFSTPIIISMVLAMTIIYLPNAKKFFSTQRSMNTAARIKLDNLSSLMAEFDFNKNDIVVADQHTSYVLPSIANVSVVVIPSGHSPRSANPMVRRECLSQLLSQDNQVRRAAITILEPAYYLLDADNNLLNSAVELNVRSATDNNSGYVLSSIDYSGPSDIYAESIPCSEIVNGNA